MIRPPTEIYDALYKAALKHNVPLTMLEALAFEASGFDARKKLEQAGKETRFGLFGFTDPQLEAYGVVDPFNAAHAIEGACLALRDIFKHLPDAAMAFAAWHLGGVVKVAHLPGTTPETWPADVRRHAEKMLRIRYWFQDRGMPRGADRLEHLKNAIQAMADLNPGLHPRINAAREALAAYESSRAPDPFFHGLQIVWLAYREAFDIVPITTEKTPIPERIEPDWWRATNNALQPSFTQLGDKLEEAAKQAGEAISSAAFIGLAVSSALAALWIVMNSRGGSRRA